MPSRGMYTVSFVVTAVIVAVDFFEIVSPTQSGIRLHALFIGQTTELGDAQEENLAYNIIRGVGTVTPGSGGSVITPVKTDQSIATDVATFTCNSLNTTKIAVGTGTLSTVHRDVISVRMGLQLIITPEMRISAYGGARLAIGLLAAPADSISFNGTAYVEEL